MTIIKKQTDLNIAAETKLFLFQPLGNRTVPEPVLVVTSKSNVPPDEGLGTDQNLSVKKSLLFEMGQCFGNFQLGINSSSKWEKQENIPFMS